MKIIMIECTAEEMRANRTILDNISEAISSVTRAFARVDVEPEDIARVYSVEDEEVKDENTSN